MASLILARVVTANNQIDRLKQEPTVESWVNEGRPLHDGKTTCQFCEQPLPHGLLVNCRTCKAGKGLRLLFGQIQ